MSNIGVYGLGIVLAAFILLLVFNPNLSCFGRKIRSPFYPLLRRRKPAAKKLTDYKFNLTDEAGARRPPASGEPAKEAKKTDDYGFRLD
jgi:hypothetical protein